MELYRLRRNAIIYDFVCIAIAMVVLFLAHRQLLPQWSLIVGALLAAAFMCASIWCLVRARKILRQMDSIGSQKGLEETPENVSPE